MTDASFPMTPPARLARQVTRRELRGPLVAIGWWRRRRRRVPAITVARTTSTAGGEPPPPI